MEKPGMGRFPLCGTGLLRGLLPLLWGLAVLPGLPAQTPRGPYWKDLPPVLTVGREARLALHPGGGRRPEKAALPPVPPMAILEALPPEGEEILAFRLIPLEGPFFILPAFRLSANGPEAPALRIPVNPAPREDTEERPAEPETGESPAGPRKLPPFPLEARPGTWIGGILERSRVLWEAGQAVEALAELRRHERDHIAGFRLAAPRRELERALLLEGEEDEVFRHPLLLIPAALLCLLLGALSLSLPALRRRPGNSRLRTWASRGFSLVFSILALLCLLRLSTVRSLGTLPAYFRGKSPRQALARRTVVYEVPEDRGRGIASLREGQGLLIHEVGNGWAYAESRREGSGWIRTGSYLIY